MNIFNLKIENSIFTCIIHEMLQIENYSNTSNKLIKSCSG